MYEEARRPGMSGKGGGGGEKRERESEINYRLLEKVN